MNTATDFNYRFKLTDYALFDRNRPRKVAIYGRVSTEHEAQLSALENQLQWYDDQVRYHPNWTVIDRYIDEGISGTQAAKRPQFMQMIRQCKQGRIDMIITKSVSRFARNTVDCIKYVRELKAMGIPVIFEKEGLNTMHATSEIYLSMHGIFAQSESESLSGNVRMGKAIYNSPITLQNRSNDFTG